MTTTFVSKKIKELPYSGIRKFFDIAAEMKDVISLGVGEPDFDTPWNVREEAIYSLEMGRTIYTSNSGLLELRQEISRYVSRKYSLQYDPSNQVLVTVGGSEAIDLVFRTIIEPGDEVLIVEPCFVSYKPCVILAGGTPVVISTKEENKFKLTKAELLDAITDKTKAILFGYPSNPTGGVMEKKDLEEIAEVLRDRNILVVSDEIYAGLTYTGSPHVSIASLPGMYDKTVVINGFSKAFSMTGWRLGYACGPKELIQEMTKVHQYAIMCAPTTSQYAAIEALKNCDSQVAEMCSQYDARRKIMVNGFREMGMDCFNPEGAFYVFPSIKKTGFTSTEFCEKLLYGKNVAVVPGSAFGEAGEGFIRCSYAYSIDNLKAALVRIAEFLDELNKSTS